MSLNGLGGSGRGGESAKAGHLAKVAHADVKAGGSRNGKSTVKQKGKSSAVRGAVLEAERASLLAEKHAELEAVVDEHDTLVREIFHMDHFLTMLGYDPKEAKKDDAAVFRDYKARLYDLVEKVAPARSRATRSVYTQRQQFISGPSVSALLPAPTEKSKIKPKTTTAMWERLGTSRGRGKGKEREVEVIEVEDFRGAQTETRADPQAAEGFNVSAETSLNHGPVEESISAIYIRKTGMKNRKGPQPESASPVREKRKESREKPPASNGPMGGSISVPSRRSGRLKVVVNETTPAVPLRHSLRASAPAPNLRALQNIPAMEVLPPPIPKFNIKRIKLVVRRPPPPLTNPLQRAPPSNFNASISKFLSSYTTLNGQDLDDAGLQHQADIDAAVYERTEKFHRQGRFIPGTDALFGFNVDTTSFTTPQRQNKDSWDHIVDAVVIYRKLRNKQPSGRQIAAQIASKIQAYWDGQATKKDKLKLQEERRLRALAKATIKMVTNEWKKAVFHIREQERLKLEAEELRRGHEHLDAILDQSGQLLETQQGDLTRGEHPHSRSSSRSVTFRDWDSEDEDEDETREEGDNDREEGHDNEDDQDMEQRPDDISDGGDVADEDGNTTNLLLDDRPDNDTQPTPVTSPSPSLLDPGDTLSPPHNVLSLVNDYTSESEHMDADNSSVSAVDGLIIPDDSDSTPLRPPPHSVPLLTDHDGDVILEDTSPTIQVQEHDIMQSSLRPSPQQSLASAPTMEDILVDPEPNPPHNLLPDSMNDTEHHSDQPSIPRDILVPSHPLSPLLVSPVHSQQQVLLGTEVHEEPMLTKDSSHEMADEGEGDLEPEPEDDEITDLVIPEDLKPFAVAPVEWDPDSKITPPLLLRGVLRPYQQSGLEWLASLHVNRVNGILADEMGLGKTIQTIALLAHLACDRGIWGPHLIVVPTSVLLNWEMEFKKFLPGFKILSYHGSTKRRKELRQGWNDKHHFNAWYYMILDEAHMIKNFKSQRWNILLMFRSYRRLLLTGTPLQNNLTELWALLQFLMSGAKFANLKEFGDWFSNPLEKAIEMGNVLDDETMQRVTKLHTVLRPYLLRRLKRDVEKELPSKYEHLVMCPLSKRQRFLYDEFMSRAQTRDALQSGVYQKIANILMQLRKVCNHPDLFEVRPIVTSFAMERSAIADFEIKELLVRRRLLGAEGECVDLHLLGLQFLGNCNTSLISFLESRRLEATSVLPFISEDLGEPPPKDTRTITGYHKYTTYLERANKIARWSHIGYLNRLRCNTPPCYSRELLALSSRFYKPIVPISAVNFGSHYWETVKFVNSAVKSYAARAEEMSSLVDRFAFVTPAVVALDMPRISLSQCEAPLANQPLDFDGVLHKASVKLQIAFPDPSLLQYDCGKLQELTRLLREKKAGGHRILIFTQMTKILDILEIFLNFHGYLYLRLDGATKVEDRQYITERFNADSRIFCFIASSRSGGVGINLTGADTVVFYDSDFNPQMDRQCEDRAHRIGQIRDVHIYRFVSQHTVEEAMLRKANQKRSLDDLVIQKGEFDWRSLFNDEGALTTALGEFEDTEDAQAALFAAKEEVALVGADEDDFTGGELADISLPVISQEGELGTTLGGPTEEGLNEELDEENEEEGGSVVEYMILMVQRDYDYFREWRL